MWLGLTIARSSPASTQWCRKPELSTARAVGETPKETFETPSEVLTCGSACLSWRMPSIVSTADGRHSSSPVVSVKVSRSKMSSSGSSPCSSQASSLMRWAISTLRAAVLAIPTSSMVRAMTAAPCWMASGTTVSSLSRPASRLTELTIARPGICSRALRMTSGSVESIWIGERDALDDLAHLLVLVLALGERDADVEHVGAALDLVLGHLHEAVVVVGQQQLLGLARALRVDALANQRGARVLHERGGGDHRADVRRARRRARPDRVARAALDDGGDVVGRRAAAAADDRHAEALDELAQDLGQRLGLLGEDRLAVGALQGQAGVGDAVHRHRAVLAEEADGVAHVLGAGGAVQAERVDLQGLQRGEDGADVGPEQHLA